MCQLKIRRSELAKSAPQETSSSFLLPRTRSSSSCSLCAELMVDVHVPINRMNTSCVKNLLIKSYTGEMFS